MSSFLLFVRRMRGNEIYDRQGNKLGNIEDVMLDGSLTTARYVVLAFHPGLTGGKKLFAVPPDALAFDSENECFVLDVLKERLSAADGFDLEAPPAAADPLFAGIGPPKPSVRSAPAAPPT
jgi:PRC-barrel domain